MALAPRALSKLDLPQRRRNTRDELSWGMANDMGDRTAKTENKVAGAKFNLKGVGFPGEPYSMVLTNIFKAPDAHLNTVPPWGLPGLYQVTFVLGKPGARAFPENEIKFAQFMEGSSHFPHRRTL